MDLEGGHGRNMGAAGLAIGCGVAFGSPLGGQLYALGPFVPLLVASGVLFLAALGSLLSTDRVPDQTRGGTAAAFRRLFNRPSLAVPFAFGFVDRLTAGFFALVGTVYFQSEFGLDAAATGMLLGAFFFPFALLQYPFGRLSDTVGRILPVAVGSIGYGVAKLKVWLDTNVALTANAMVPMGKLGALVAPATMALVTDLAAADQRGVAMGGFNIFGSLGFLVGIVGGATIAGSVGFRAAFLAVGAAEIGIALVALPLLFRLDVPVRPWQE
jgi:MFS family permease